jgi:hypothetical protein
LGDARGSNPLDPQQTISAAVAATHDLERPVYDKESS